MSEYTITASVTHVGGSKLSITKIIKAANFHDAMLEYIRLCQEEHLF